MDQVSEKSGQGCKSSAAGAPHSQLKFAARIRCALFIPIYLLLIGKSQAAPVLFDPANYTGLAKTDSARTIKPGTRITLQNWQHYRSYLPFGIQVLYTGQYHWKVTSSPDFTITVGPTIDYTWARRYLEDTEKYGNQTRLVKIDTGGYGIEN